MVKLIGLDTETVIKDKVHEFYSFQVYSEDFKHCSHFSTNKDDFEKLLRFKTHRAWFITFNLSFDAIVISRMLKDKDYKISAFYAGSRLIRLTIRRGNLKWVVVDLRNIFPNTNLERIGNILNYHKLDKPEYLGKRQPETEEERAYFKRYAMRDAEICYKMAKLIQEEFKIIKSTCAGLAMRIFARDYCHCNKFYPLHDNFNDKVRLAYHGGRTECFIRGLAFEPLKCYDVNSLYPYVMLHKNYPFVLYAPERKNDIDFDREGITKAVIQCDTAFPPIAIKHMCKDGLEKLCFVNGKYEGWFTNVELKELEQYDCGKVLRVRESYEWKDCTNNPFNPFLTYITDFYSKKKEATKNNSPKSALYKIMLNGLYGKFGEHGETSFYTCDNGVMIDKQLGKQRHAWYHSPIIASYITAYARLHLWHILRSLNPEKVYYCDTDSVWTSQDLSNKVSDNLGDLKIEHECSKLDASFFRAKCYMYNNKMVMKGFQITDTWQNLIVSILNGNLTRLEHRITKALEAQRTGKQALYDTDILKTYSLLDDGKRNYLKFLDNKTILMNNTQSLPLEVKI